MGIGKKRKDCFFGVHFDFHAMPGEVVARYVSHESITKMLDEVKPEYVQIDTKGHAGLSSYPTKVGNPASEIKEDMLRFWRDETKKRGIALYAHHSGLYEWKVIEQHPDWAVVDEDGNASDSYISVFSPYCKEFLAPQIMELAGKYDLDGVWVDGESWCVYPDYSTYAERAWKEKTGGKDLPKCGDSDYGEYCDFLRLGYENHVESYLTAVKEKYPDFQITSNWMYSSEITTKPRVKVDFLSGDYSCTNSVNSARHLGRGMLGAGIPWDLMAWGQNCKKGTWDDTDRTVKETDQYCQEAAVILSLGGGFEFFNIIYGGGGYIQEWAIPRWKKTRDFCMGRKDLCWNARLLPEIAVVYPEVYENQKSALLCSGKYYKNRVMPWILALQNNGLPSDMIREYKLIEEPKQKYSLIIVPSAAEWRPETLSALKEYTKKGGRLVVEGESAKYFSDLTGISFGKVDSDRLIFVDGGESLASLRTNYYNQSSTTAIQTQDAYEWNYYRAEERLPAALSSSVEEGSIHTVLFDFSKHYLDNITEGLNGFVRGLIKSTGFVPVAEIAGTKSVDLTVTVKNKCLIVNMVNMSGSHDRIGVRTFSEVLPIYGFKVSIKCSEKPKSITLEPDGVPLAFDWDGERATVTVEKLHIHSAIKITDWEK